jgi:hypothetical protein
MSKTTTQHSALDKFSLHFEYNQPVAQARKQLREQTLRSDK